MSNQNDNERFVALVNFAVDLQKQGKLSEAVTHYRDALKLAPDHPVLLLARCEQGGNAVKAAAKLFGGEAGDIVIGGKKLKPFEVEKLLGDRLAVIKSTLLDKYTELGIVAIEA